MSVAAMTSRERVVAALERRDHDRIPRADGYWPETIRRWRSEGFEGDEQAIRRLLGQDLQCVRFAWPRPFPGKEELVADEGATKVVKNDMDQTVRVSKETSTTPEHIDFGCKTSDDWRDIYRPALEKVGPPPPDQRLKNQYAGLREREAFACACGVEAYEAIRQLVGDETMLIAAGEEPEWIVEMAEFYTDKILEVHQADRDAGLESDAIWVFGDVAYNHGPFMSPTMYRELIAPSHKRILDFARERDMKFIYHSDGDIRPYLPDFVGMGYDAIQPMEAKAGMDVRELAPLYGERLSFFGNINMALASTGDLDALEHEVRTKLEAAKPYNGYIYHSDHSVPPTVSWATYSRLLELIDEHGRYA